MVSLPGTVNFTTTPTLASTNATLTDDTTPLADYVSSSAGSNKTPLVIIVVALFSLALILTVGLLLCWILTVRAKRRQRRRRRYSAANAPRAQMDPVRDGTLLPGTKRAPEEQQPSTAPISGTTLPPTSTDDPAPEMPPIKNRGGGERRKSAESAFRRLPLPFRRTTVPVQNESQFPNAHAALPPLSVITQRQQPQPAAPPPPPPLPPPPPPAAPSAGALGRPNKKNVSLASIGIGRARVPHDSSQPGTSQAESSGAGPHAPAPVQGNPQPSTCSRASMRASHNGVPAIFAAKNRPQTPEVPVTEIDEI